MNRVVICRDPDSVGYYASRQVVETMQRAQGQSEGISTVLDNSKEVILLATGRSKAQAVAIALLGPVSGWIPASYLREHDRCTFYLDKSAAATFEQVLEEKGCPDYIQAMCIDS